MVKKQTDIIKKPKALPKDFGELEVCIEDYQKSSLRKIDNIDFESFEGNLQVYISNTFFQTCEYFKNRHHQELTKEDYEIGFNAFNKVLSKLNEKTVYNATTYTFSQFMGIAERTLKKHSEQNNPRGNVVRLILDKLAENHLQTLQGDRINAVSGIFIAKAVHGLRDNENPNINILNINSSSKSVEDIMAEYTNSKNF